MKRIIIGLVGESGSGKDTVADYLKDTYNARLLRFSDPIKEILKMFFDKPSREDQAWIAVNFKKRFGKDIFHRAIERKITERRDLLSLNGLRYMEDYDFLKKFEDSYLLYVTASQKHRWERVFSRKEKSDDNLTLKEFADMEASLETERDIPEIGKQADYTIKNESTMEDLFTQTDTAMRAILKKSER